jgi:WD40 repeat protein
MRCALPRFLPLLALFGVGAALAQDGEGGGYRLVAVHGLPELSALSFSPDGTRLYAGGTDDLVRVFAVPSLTQEDSFGGRGARIDHLALAPDGSTVAAGDRDGAVTLFDAWSGEELYRFGGNGRPIVGLSWSEDGKQLGVASMHGPLRLVDGDSGRPLEQIQGPGEWFTRVAFALEHGKVAATGTGGDVRIWTLPGGQLIKRLEVGGVETTQLAWSPDGQRIAGADWDGRIRVWDVASGELLATLKGEGKTGGLRFLPDGRLIARGEDDSPRIWSLDGSVDRGFEPPPRWTGLREAEAPEQASLESVHQRLDATWDPIRGRIAEAYGGTLRIWSADGQLLASRDTGLAGVTAVAVDPDGRLVAQGDRQGRVLVRASLLGDVTGVLALHEGPVQALDWSSAADTLAIAGPDHLLRTWQVLEGQLNTVYFGHEQRLTDASFDLSGGRLASGSEDGTVRLWSLGSPEPQRTLEAHEQGVNRIAWSSDGRLASWPRATPDPGPGAPPDQPRAFFASGEPNMTLRVDHGDGFGAWAPGSSRLASATFDDMALIDGYTGQRRPDRHGAARLHDLRYSHDGSVLVGGTEGGSVYVMDGRTGALQLALRGHAGPVNALAFSGDDSLLVSGSEDGTVRVWKRD